MSSRDNETPHGVRISISKCPGVDLSNQTVDVDELRTRIPTHDLLPVSTHTVAPWETSLVTSPCNFGTRDFICRFAPLSRHLSTRPPTFAHAMIRRLSLKRRKRLEKGTLTLVPS